MKQDNRKNPLTKQTFRYKSAIIFGLTSIIPLLIFVFIVELFDLTLERIVVLMAMLGITVAVLGFLFFLKTVAQVNNIAHDFARVERGEIDRLGEREIPAKFAEMAHIADSFDNMLDEMKERTSEFDSQITKLTTLSELTQLVSTIPDIKEILHIVLRRAMATAIQGYTNSRQAIFALSP